MKVSGQSSWRIDNIKKDVLRRIRSLDALVSDEHLYVELQNSTITLTLASGLNLSFREVPLVVVISFVLGGSPRKDLNRQPESAGQN